MTPPLSPAPSRDTAAMAAVHATAFAAPWSAADLAAMLAHAETAAFALTGGFILMRTVAGEAEVLTLAVDPAHRRQGLARALLTAGVDWSVQEGAEAVFLEVAEDNAAAIGLYRGSGFSQVGRRRGYYARPGGAVDALVLRRDLNTGGA